MYELYRVEPVYTAMNTAYSRNAQKASVTGHKKYS